MNNSEVTATVEGMVESAVEFKAVEVVKKEAPITPATYLDLIKEVYIEPIRSAIVVDDNYPTLDDYLNNTVGEKSGSDLLPIINACRGAPWNWSIDVNDGKAIDGTEYRQLHQSDLMILDYHLEGDEAGGTKAIKVLRSLAGNNYFNLVIVYTASNSVEETNSRILTLAEGLINIKPSLQEGVIQVPQEVSDWEEVDTDIVSRLDNSINKETLLKFIQQPNFNKWKTFVGLDKLANLIHDRATTGKVSVGQPTVEWLIRRKVRPLIPLLSSEDFGEVEFSLGDINWIKTNKLFVTVIPKNAPAAELPERLLKALEASKPSPHQLLMTKIRNVLDEKGVIAERTVLSKKRLQAYWLHQMLHAEESEYPWQLNKTIDHHWNSLAAGINHEIHHYGSTLFKTVKNDDSFNAGEFIKLYTYIDISKPSDMQSIKEEWNSFVSTKKPDTPYISTGSIFKIKKQESGKEIEEFWVCLSPACDLVPGQKAKWANKKIDKAEILPLKAVMLLPEKNNIRSMDLVNGNEFIFINTGEAVKSFCFVATPNSGSNPSWNQFFAHNNGYYDKDYKFEISCFDIQNIKGGKLEPVKYVAELVTQLRYEYALNLLQKLGGSLSRVGLDFVEHAKPEEPKKKETKSKQKSNSQ